MQKITMVCNICSEIKTNTVGDTSVSKFSVAVSRKYKKDGQPDADFFNCESWGKTGEVIQKYFEKGSRIAIHGRLQNNNYEKDGVKHYGNIIIVEEVDFCGSKQSGNSSDNGRSQPVSGTDGFMNIEDGSDEILPFN